MWELILAVLAAGSLAAVLTLVAFVRGWIVTGSEHRRTLADRDGWRNMALDQLSANRQIRETTRQAVETVKDLATTSAGPSAPKFTAAQVIDATTPTPVPATAATETPTRPA